MTLVGALLGGIPLVRDNIDILAIVIVLVSVLPIVIGAVVKARKVKAAGDRV
jgi:membrane-associated protein